MRQVKCFSEKTLSDLENLEGVTKLGSKTDESHRSPFSFSSVCGSEVDIEVDIKVDIEVDIEEENPIVVR